MIKKISHIAIVVPEIENILSFWHDSLGLPLSHTEQVAEQDVNVAFLPVGESEIELLQPLSEESGIGRFLSKKGAGIHHICFEVEGLEAMLVELAAQGVPLINERPVRGAGGKQVAFIHPKGTGGVLVELSEDLPQ